MEQWVISLHPLLQESVTVCYIKTSFVPRNYNSVLRHYLLYYKKI